MAKDKAQYQHRLELGLCPKCGKARDDTRITCTTCRTKHNQGQIKLRTKSEAVRNREKNNYRKLREETIIAYGGICVCCGQDHIPYLQLDHVLGGGSEHRKALGLTSTSYFYWLKRNNYPDLIQLLCANCHNAKTTYNECKHTP
jgi:hypothetical protein